MQSLKKILTLDYKNRASFLGSNQGKMTQFGASRVFFQKLGSVTFFQA